MTGKTLAHYQVLEKLGQGAMGEVYRATDTKLACEVAIKVLPPEFARDPERLVRFEREARALAWLVLELVEGRTIESPLPVEDAIAIARQICEALEAAHEKGIIHLDLKPANVKITPEGKVKVLDFGLAKAFTEDPVPERFRYIGSA